MTKSITECRIEELENDIIKNILRGRKDVNVSFRYIEDICIINIEVLKVYNSDLCKEANRLSQVSKSYNRNMEYKIMSLMQDKDTSTLTITLKQLNKGAEFRIELLESLLEELLLIKYDETKILDRISVLMKPTHRCNMNCSYCYDKPFRDTIKEDMDMETLDNVFKVLTKSVNSLNIIWHGGEMTLLGTQWFKTAHELINSKYPGIVNEYSCMSNGLLFNEEWFKTFKELNIEPGISYNYSTQTELRSDIDIDNILELDRKYNSKLGIIDVITNKNADRNIEAYDYYNSKKVPACFNRVFVTEQASENELLLNETEYSESFSRYFDHVLNHRNPSINERSIMESINFFIDPRDNTCTFNDCRNKWIGVNPIGDVYPCDRYFPDMYKAGNIKDFSNLEDIFYSKGYLKYVEDVEHRMLKHCRQCDYYVMCMGGCNANSITATGTCREPDENFCKVIKKIIDTSYLKFREIDLLNPCMNTSIITTIINKNSYTSKEIISAYIEINPDIKEFIEFKEGDYLNPLQSNEFKVFKSINYLDEDVKLRHFKVSMSNTTLNNQQELENLIKLRKDKLIRFIREVSMGC